MLDEGTGHSADIGALQIRPAHAAQADALTVIARNAKAHWGYSPRDLARWQAELTVTPEQIHDQNTWVAEKGGELIGFCRLDFSGATAERTTELTDLFVEPNWLRQGVGKALLQTAAREVLRSGNHRLSVDADPNALVFYRAMGAQQIAEFAAPADGQPDRVRPQLLFDAAALQELVTSADGPMSTRSKT